MAARKNRGSTKGSMPKEWKDKIRASQIANRFMKCFEGEIELKPDQLKAGELLFKRLEPELSRVEQNTTLSNPDGSGVFQGVEISGVKVKAGVPGEDT